MIKKLLFFCIYLLLTSCSTSIKKIDSNLAIDNFSMTHFKVNGDKLYAISSPKSLFIKDIQIYKLDNSKILFYEVIRLNVKVFDRYRFNLGFPEICMCTNKCDAFAFFGGLLDIFKKLQMYLHSIIWFVASI